MKQKWIIIMFLLPVQLFSQAEDKNFDFHFKDIPLSEFVDSILGRTGVRVYYDKNLAGKIRISIDADSITVHDAVIEALAGTGLNISKWNDDIIVSAVKLISGLPSYDQNVPADSVTLSEKALQPDESKILKIKGREVLRTVAVGQRTANIARKIIKVNGKVIDQETGEPLISVPVFITDTKTGVLSGPDGSFTLALLPGRYIARISYLGYDEESLFLKCYPEVALSLASKKRPSG